MMLLIVNPMAGLNRPEATSDRLLQALHHHDARVTLCSTTKRGDAEEAARRAVARGCERVVVAGGDGTVNEAANGLLESGVPMGVIPVGTANVLARELGIPFDIPAACALAASGAPRPVDVGIANGRAFFLAAGVGFDAQLIQRLSVPLKRRIGIPAYWLAGALHLMHARPAMYRLNVDGKELAEPLYGILVCNTCRYAGRYCLSPEARVDDGRLDLYLLHARGFPGLLRMLLALARNRVDECPHVTHRQAGALDCRTEPVLPYQLDGDVLGSSPVSIHVLAGALRVVAPSAPEAD